MYFSRVRLRSEIITSRLNRVLKGNVYGVHRLLWDLFSEQQRSFLYREEIAREQLGYLPKLRGEPVYYMLLKSSPVEPENSLFKVETKNYQPRLEAGQHLGFECRVNPVITKKGKKHDVVMDAQLDFLKTLTKAFDLEKKLPENVKKKDYKKLLLSMGGEALAQHLTGKLANDPRYAERAGQVSTLSDKLEWSVKAQIETALENWWRKQGERCGFNLAIDKDALIKLQDSAYQWHAIPEKGRNAGFSSVDLRGELEITDVNQFQNALFNGIGRSKAFGCGLMMIRRI